MSVSYTHLTFLASKPSGTNLAIPFPTITLRATFTFLVEALVDKDNVTSKLIAVSYTHLPHHTTYTPNYLLHHALSPDVR